MSAPIRRAGRILFHQDDPERSYSMPDPRDRALDDSMYALRHNPDPNRSDVLRVLDAAELYVYFATSRSPTKTIVTQLRELRRAVKDGAK